MSTETVVAEVAAERERQKSIEGWLEEHDDEHADESLALAAAAYATPEHHRTMTFKREGAEAWAVPEGWPRFWHAEWWKPKDRRRDLIRAAALIVAEIERLDRASQEPPR